VGDAPNLASYVAALAAFAAECAGGPLNVNELRTVLRVLQAVAAASPAAGGVGAGWGLFVPDAQGVLVPSARAVYDDAPWLAGRLRAGGGGATRGGTSWGGGAAAGGAGGGGEDLLSSPLLLAFGSSSSTSSTALTLVHPRLGSAVCVALSIPPLSSRVVEQLSPACQPQPTLGSGGGNGEGGDVATAAAKCPSCRSR
jgi:hypothetical protein